MPTMFFLMWRASKFNDLVTYFVTFGHQSLSQCIQFSRYFSEKARRTHPISTASIDEAGKKKVIPASTEAMAVLLYKNQYNKWLELKKWRIDEENDADTLPKYNVKDPTTHRFKCLYSDSCSGRNGFECFSDEGIEEYNRLLVAISQNLKLNKDRVSKVDGAFVDRMYKSYLAAEKVKCEKEGKDFAKVMEDRKKRAAGGQAKKGNKKSRVTVLKDEEE